MKLVQEFTVKKSPAEVFDYIAINYFDNHSKFDPDIHEMIWRTSPPVAKGTKGTERRSFAGLPIFLNFEVTDFDTLKHFAFKNTSGPFLLERSYYLEKVNNGTKVTFVFDIQPRNIMVKPVLLILKKNFKNTVKHNIELLRQQLS